MEKKQKSEKLDKSSLNFVKDDHTLDNISSNFIKSNQTFGNILQTLDKSSYTFIKVLKTFGNKTFAIYLGNNSLHTYKKKLLQYIVSYEGGSPQYKNKIY